MADGSANVKPVRLAKPLLDDICYVARRMRQDERAQYEAVTGEPYDADAASRIFASFTGPSYSLLGPDGLPFLVAGFEYVRPGVWQTWMLGTEDGWAKHWREITRQARVVCANMLATDAQRLQTYALASRTLAHKWYAKGMGFTYEGTHPCFFADGQAAVCYARTREAPHGID